MRKLLLLLAIPLLMAPSCIKKPVPNVNSFSECVSAGFAIMESYPRQCRDSQGNLFVEDIGNELDKLDNIILDYPRPNQEITSPLEIKGQARGTWFFEASFPVVLTDWDGLIIAEGYVTAKDDWMTEKFIPFEGTLEFDIPEYKNNGSLILQKDNPSGLPEYDDALEIPVLFKESEGTKDCLPNQRDADFCIEIYQPVCANVRVQCIKAPCPEVQETYSNSCEACKNSLVYTYTEGKCE